MSNNEYIHHNELILYHGSRGGIVGDIKPNSRIRCDFGKGFYMGTNASQAKSLVANDPSPIFYKLSFNIENIPADHILELKDMDWAYFVLFNRGKLNEISNTPFYERYKHIADEKDVIIGLIADDAMNETMNRFLNNTITDKAFLESIRALDFGIQYTAKTPKACSCIEILEEKDLSGKELNDAVVLANNRRIIGKQVAEEMQRKYRREGLYLDEILEAACQSEDIEWEEYI